MSTGKFKKNDLDAALRTFSIRNVLMLQTAADAIGLNATDYKCFDLLQLSDKPMTPGEIAQVSGLTTGAVTGVVDRLERANLVRREADKTDRRRILITPTHARDEELTAMFTPFTKGMYEAQNEFKVAELEVITRFMRTVSELMIQQTHHLRSGKKN
jgi:DNA-binding MarR family transcriptional regulator